MPPAPRPIKEYGPFTLALLMAIGTALFYTAKMQGVVEETKRVHEATIAETKQVQAKHDAAIGALVTDTAVAKEAVQSIKTSAVVTVEMLNRNTELLNRHVSEFSEMKADIRYLVQAARREASESKPGRPVVMLHD